MYEEQVEKFVEAQRQAAVGQRKEMLGKRLAAEKKMLAEVIIPVLRSFDGLTMEYELISQNGIRIFIDVCYEPLRLAFESEGYAVHAESITRDRFDFEKVRQRTLVAKNIRFVPFSWDELDKKPDTCRRSLAEIIGVYAASRGSSILSLPVYHREVIRYAILTGNPLRIRDVMKCLDLKANTAAKVLHEMYESQLLVPVGRGTIRHHEYILSQRARAYLLE